MLTLVEVRTSQGDFLSLPLHDVVEGYPVDLIEGLDPVKATLVSSSFAQMDGAQYHSSRRESRNIKIRLGLEPNYAYEELVKDLRQRLYTFFMPKTLVNLTFYLSTGLIVNIDGRVESFDSALYTQDPAVDISIICFDPDFYSPNSTSMSLLSTASEVDSLVPYIGTIETGVKFTVYVNRNLSEFTIYHRTPSNELRSMDFALTLIAGDVLEISTVPGSKYVTLTRAGVQSSVLYALSIQSSWIELMSGDNYIRLYAKGVGIPFDIVYTTKYGGL